MFIMELEQQNEVYRQTIEALNAQNERLKQELSQAYEQIAQMERIAHMPENGVQQTYRQMLEYCNEAMSYRNEMKRLVEEMALAKNEYMHALKESLNEYF